MSDLIVQLVSINVYTLILFHLIHSFHSVSLYAAVVRPGRNFYREAPPETGVAVPALHSREAGAGYINSSFRSTEQTSRSLPAADN